MSPLRRIGVFLSAVATTCTLAACGADEPDTDAPSGAGESPASTASSTAGRSPSAAPPAGADPSASQSSSSPMPDVPDQLAFTSPTIEGGTFDARTLAGQDAMIYFWAPWCPICRREAPGLPPVVDEYDVAFVTVGGSSQDVDQMAEFVADVGFGEAINIADTSGEVWTRFGVTYQYTYGFVDDSGTVEIVSGPLDEADLRDRLDALVAS